MKLLTLANRMGTRLPLAFFALLTTMIARAQGTMDTQHAGRMEALVARGFGASGELVGRQATNLQVRTLSGMEGVDKDEDI
jgi:hypothetical protein